MKQENKTVEKLYLPHPHVSDNRGNSKTCAIFVLFTWNLSSNTLCLRTRFPLREDLSWWGTFRKSRRHRQQCIPLTKGRNQKLLEDRGSERMEFIMEHLFIKTHPGQVSQCSPENYIRFIATQTSWMLWTSWRWKFNLTWGNTNYNYLLHFKWNKIAFVFWLQYTSFFQELVSNVAYIKDNWKISNK